jgi:hypothetical protein
MKEELLLKLLPVLEEMLAKCEANDRPYTLGLNHEFSLIFNRYVQYNGNRKILPEIAREYDNCRQSCIMSLELQEIREKLLEDARIRLERIRGENNL